MVQKIHLAPFVRFSIVLALGIVGQVYFDFFNIENGTILLGSFSTLYIFVFLLNKMKHRPIYPLLLGALAYIFIGILGSLIADWHNLSKRPDFFGNKTDIVAYEGIVDSEVQRTVRSAKCFLRIYKVKQGDNWVDVEGKVLVYMDTAFVARNKLEYGDRLMVKSAPKPTLEPKNPGEFNYKRYLSFIQVYHRDYISSRNAIKFGGQAGNPIIAISTKSRLAAGKIIESHIKSIREASILTALVVGVRGELDEEMVQAYSSAGAMHVLSVSGLHVALVFQMLTWMIGGIRFQKIGKWLYYLISLFLIWGYAFLTGMCPSVMRSVVMFTVILMGQAFNKNANTINSIAFSAFILLVYNPFIIMDVGFQLSYLAVLGIVYLQPKIYSWFEVKNKIGDWVWQITTVSLAAQLATFPLGILYFHQFPTYFLVSNLVVIPASTVMLYGGIGFFAISWVPFLGDYYGYVLEKITWLTNEFLMYNQQLPGAVWEGIYVEVWETWLIFGWIAAFVWLFEFKRFLWMITLFVFSIVGSKRYLFRNYRQP